MREETTYGDSRGQSSTPFPSKTFLEYLYLPNHAGRLELEAEEELRGEDKESSSSVSVSEHATSRDAGNARVISLSPAPERVILSPVSYNAVLAKS